MEFELPVSCHWGFLQKFPGYLPSMLKLIYSFATRAWGSQDLWRSLCLLHRENPPGRKSRADKKVKKYREKDKLAKLVVFKKNFKKKEKFLPALWFYSPWQKPPPILLCPISFSKLFWYLKWTSLGIKMTSSLFLTAWGAGRRCCRKNCPAYWRCRLHPQLYPYKVLASVSLWCF